MGESTISRKPMTGMSVCVNERVYEPLHPFITHEANGRHVCVNCLGCKKVERKIAQKCMHMGACLRVCPQSAKRLKIRELRIQISPISSVLSHGHLFCPLTWVGFCQE